MPSKCSRRLCDRPSSMVKDIQDGDLTIFPVHKEEIYRHHPIEVIGTWHRCLSPPRRFPLSFTLFRGELFPDPLNNLLFGPSHLEHSDEV